MLLEDVVGLEYKNQIEQSSFGEEKVSALEDKSLLEFFSANDFNGHHVSQIVCNKGWQEKLNWAKDNFEEILKPMGFNGYHYSQIVCNKGWQEKLNWAKDNFEEILKPMGFNGYHYSQIVCNKGWQEKLN